jgi:Skp family chaperone for outer membrane proteins
MKKSIVIVAGVVALGGFAYLGNQLRAQPQQPFNGAPMTTAPQMPPAVTRVAVFNINQVIRNYVKFKIFEQQRAQEIQEVNKNVDAIKAQLAMKQTEASKPETTQARKEQLEKEYRDLQRNLQDLGEEAKARLAKKQMDYLIQTYKEIQEAAAAYARVRNIELVMHYSDAIGNDVWQPQFFVRKLESGACYPMYMHPGLDITQALTDMLNSRVAQSAVPQQPTAPPVQPAGFQQQR